jgi:hypothetical protein
MDPTVRERVATIEAHVLHIRETLDAHVKNAGRVEKRVARLERVVAWGTGVVAAAGVVFKVLLHGRL